MHGFQLDLAIGKNKPFDVLAVTIIFLLLALFPLLLASPVLRVGAQQSSFTNLVSYRIAGAPNYTSPGNESFWKSINWTSIPLSASVSPGRGHTPKLLVK